MIIEAPQAGRELPPGWEWATLNELCTVNPRSFHIPPIDDELISRVTMSDVEAMTGRMDTSTHVPYGPLKQKSLTHFQDGDVIFAKITPCMENGKIALAQGLEGGRGLGSTEFYVFRPREAIDPKFLMYYLLQTTIRREAEGQMTGAVGQRRVPRSHLENLRLPIPPLSEQHRIVIRLESHLARIAIGIAASKAALADAASLRANISAQGVIGHLKSDGELRQAPLGDAGVDDGHLPDLPAGWSWVRLGGIADVVGGVTKDTKRQGDSDFVEVPYLRVANVQRGRLDLSSIATIRVPKSKAVALRLEPGDVLLNEGGDRDKLGRGWVWEGQIENCIHQNHVFRARIHPGRLHSKLLAWHANGFGKSWCDTNGSQVVNLASISLRKIKLLPVPVPPIGEQDRLVALIDSHLKAVSDAAVIAEEALAESENLREAVLAAAFSGKLVPQDPADEPAAVSLERIRAELATIATSGHRERDAIRPRSKPRSTTSTNQGVFPQ